MLKVIKNKSKSIFLLSFILLLTLTFSGCDNGVTDDSGEPVSTTYTLTIEVEGEGTTEPEPGTHEINDGEIVDIKAIPDDGYHFLEWEGNVQESENEETSILIEEDETVLAKLEEIDGDIIGEGTANNPFIIYTFNGLEKVGQSSDYPLDAYYRLGANINASITGDRSYNDGEGWSPIGDSDEPFIGYFDGQDYKIEGLQIDREEESNIGLFGVAEDSDISNLNLININFEGQSYIGGLVGANYNTNIKNISVRGYINNIANEWYIGGLVGLSENSMILNCHTDVEISSNSTSIGGLIGRNRETEIVNCYALGDVIGDRDDTSDFGGLVGSNYKGDIRKSYAEGNVVGRWSGGGIIGLNDGAEIKECYATGDVKVYFSNGGGLIGLNEHGNVYDSYSEGNVEALKKSGGLIGENKGNILNSHSKGDIRGRESVGGLIGYNNGTFEEVKECYSTGKVTGNSNGIGGLIGANSHINIINCYALGDVIGDRDDTNNFGGLVGSNYKGDINKSYATGNVVGNQAGGGLVGSASGGNISETFALGDVTGDGNMGGGLVGQNSSDSIKDSYYKGNVKAHRSVGGLIGRNDGEIENCYSIAEVKGYDNIGGLIGSNYDSTYDYTAFSYWDKDIGPEVSAGGEGKTTTELQSQNTFENWDFNGIWTIDENSSYPYFQWQDNNIPTPSK